MDQLCGAGLINRIFQTGANGIPLQAQVNEKKFKLLFLDVGLMQNANKIDPNVILNQDVWQVNEGAIAEQFVGQELLNCGKEYENTVLYFWEREEGSSTAQVDYVSQIDSLIVPLEVKAGLDGRKKSLKRFMDEKKVNLGVMISQRPLEKRGNVLHLPFYLIGEMSRLIKKE